MSKTEDKKFVGEWWIPGKAKRKVKGTLYLDSAGETVATPRLELLGLFEQEDLTKFFSVAETHPQVVFGEAGGKLFSLFQNEVSEKAVGLKVPHATLQPRLVLEGIHLKDLTEDLFTSLTIEYTHLEDWCSENTFFGDVVFDDEKVLRVNLSGVPFKSDPIELPALESELTISHNILHRHEKYKKVELTDAVTMKFKADIARSFEWFERVIEKFQVMLAFFTGRAVYPARFALDGEKRHRPKKSGSGTTSKFRARVFFTPSRERQAELSATPPQVIVPFSAIKTNAGAIINSYLEKYESLEQVFQLLLASVYQPDFLAQSRFLNLMQALETFHRRTGKGGAAAVAEGAEGNYLSDVLYGDVQRELADAYRKIFSKFVGEISTPAGKAAYPNDDAKNLAKLEQILTKRLATSNGASLRSRMELIFKSLSKDESKLVCDKPKSFVHHTTSTRDYLTHYDETLKASSLRGIELFRATEGMRILLILLVMRELGVERETRIELIKQNNRMDFRSFSAVEFK